MIDLSIDYGDVQVGDVVTLKARTAALPLADIFYPSPQEDAQKWAAHVQATFRANQVQNTVISLTVTEGDDRHREFVLELQATYVGDLPFQGVPGSFYGYDEDGNLLTEQEFVDRGLAANLPDGGFVAGINVSWKLVILAAIVAAPILGYELDTYEAYVDHETTITGHTSGTVAEVGDTIKTTAIAAAIIAIAYLLSKA